VRVQGTSEQVLSLVVMMPKVMVSQMRLAREKAEWWVDIEQVLV
jgi:hypothetical protein